MMVSGDLGTVEGLQGPFWGVGISESFQGEFRKFLVSRELSVDFKRGNGNSTATILKSVRPLNLHETRSIILEAALKPS